MLGSREADRRRATNADRQFGDIEYFDDVVVGTRIDGCDFSFTLRLPIASG